MILSRQAIPRRARKLLLAVGLLSIGFGGVFGGVAQADTSGSGLGINGWYLFWQTPRTQWDAQLANVAADNIKVVRTDALWYTAEPTAPVNGVHHYTWSTLDAIAGALARHGLQWLPIIDYTTPWAESVSGNIRSAPTDQASYAAFAAAVVARYGPGGAFWAANPWLSPQPVTAVEIWNEENSGSTPVPAAQYVPMYEAARAAIHAVNPSVEAVVGGLVNSAAAYLNQMYGVLKAAGQIDAVAQHPYDLTPSATINDVVRLRSALDGAGDTGVPIDITELGWPTSGSASFTTTLTDAVRAIQLPQTIKTLATSDCGIERVLPYAWNTAQVNPANVEDWFGIANVDGSPTLTSAALALQYGALQGAWTGGPATSVVCNRPLTLKLAQVSAPAGSSANLCVQASVLSYSWAGPASAPIPGAPVSFTGPNAASVTTGSDGQATACFTGTVGQATAITATASSPAFHVVPSASVTVTPTVPASVARATSKATKKAKRHAANHRRPRRHHRTAHTKRA